MTLADVLVEVWRQVLVEGKTGVEVQGVTRRVGRTRNGYRVVSFVFAERAIDGIEQNPNTRSRWAKLAQSGSLIMQFTSGGRYFANVCDGTVTRYPAWKALALPE